MLMDYFSWKFQGTSRSRTMTIPQISKELENNEGSGDQTTAHEQVQGTSRTNDVIEGSDDVTDGVIVDFRDERNNRHPSLNSQGMFC